MAMTKEEFKRRWESNEHGGGITNDDCAECYVEWGLGSSPKTKAVDEIVDAVVKAAGCSKDIKDVRKKLQPPDFQELIQGKDSLDIGFGDSKEVHMDIDALRNIKPLGEVTTDILFDNELLISKEDYKYWWSSTRRINKLFGTTTTVNKVEQLLIKVGIANISESGLECLKVCEGTKKEVIDFINEQLSDRHLKSFGESIVVLKFNYVDEDKEHPERWLTIEELAEKGEVTLQ